MESALSRITNLLRSADSAEPPFPPTVLYEESWLLRLVLDWFAGNRDHDHPLAFDDRARWFSEGRLASAFLPRRRGDRLAEGYTHADGVVGHFSVGSAGQTDLKVASDATVLKVIEAKMFSRLSSGTTYAPGYNQAARSVACVAKILELARRQPSDVVRLAFYVIAPRGQIERGLFAQHLAKDDLERVVRRRVEDYDESRTEWFQSWFLPTLQQIQIETLSWEDVIDHIVARDTAFGGDLTEFYARCLRFNQAPANSRR